MLLYSVTEFILMNNKTYRKIDLNSDVVIWLRFILEQTKTVRRSKLLQLINSSKNSVKFGINFEKSRLFLDLHEQTRRDKNSRLICRSCLCLVINHRKNLHGSSVTMTSSEETMLEKKDNTLNEYILEIHFIFLYTFCDGYLGWQKKSTVQKRYTGLNN